MPFLFFLLIRPKKPYIYRNKLFLFQNHVSETYDTNLLRQTKGVPREPKQGQTIEVAIEFV